MSEVGTEETNRPVAGIRPPPPLCREDNLSANWKLFKLKWHNYAIITYLTRQSLQYQTALLLHTLGDEALKVYYGFQFSTPEDERTPTKIMQAFDKYAIGETNETYESYIFHTRKQGESKTVESFITALQTLVKMCNFCDNCFISTQRSGSAGNTQPPDTSRVIENKTVEIAKMPWHL